MRGEEKEQKQYFRYVYFLLKKKEKKNCIFDNYISASLVCNVSNG